MQKIRVAGGDNRPRKIDVKRALSAVLPWVVLAGVSFGTTATLVDNFGNDAFEMVVAILAGGLTLLVMSWNRIWERTAR